MDTSRTNTPIDITAGDETVASQSEEDSFDAFFPYFVAPSRTQSSFYIVDTAFQEFLQDLFKDGYDQSATHPELLPTSSEYDGNLVTEVECVHVNPYQTCTDDSYNRCIV
jgi:hypothetical protein